MAKKSKSNKVLIKLYVPETGEYKVRAFNRQKIDVATFERKGYSSKLRKTVTFKAKKLK